MRNLGVALITAACACAMATPAKAVPRAPFIAAAPASARMDESVRLLIRGIPRGQKIEVRAELTDDAGVTWQSRAHYVARRGSTLDPARDPSVGGTYRGVDRNGLFWSMVPLDKAGKPIPPEEFVALAAGSTPHSLTPVLARDKPFVLRLTAVKNGQPIASKAIERRWLDPRVQRSEIAEGAIRGVLYQGTNRAGNRAIILLTGSGGGVDRDWAPLLAARGYSVLALGYFGYKDRPAAPADLPLEYFTEAVRWLQQKVGHDNIAMLGISRGTEAAMLTAAHHPGLIKAVVAIAPGHLSTPGFHPEKGLNVSTWSLAGKPLPFAPFPPIQLDKLASKHDAPARALRQSDWYAQMYRRHGVNEAVVIPVEKMEAPLLLVSGTADAIWPSKFSGDFILSRLKQRRYPHEVRHIVIPEAGHSIWMSPNIVTTYAHMGFHRMARAFTTSGGTPANNSEGAAAALEGTDSFLRRNLN